MIQYGGATIYSGSDFDFYLANIYTGSAWKKAVPYVYNGSSWQKLGAAGCAMIPFKDSAGQEFYDSTPTNFLVRKEKSPGRLTLSAYLKRIDFGGTDTFTITENLSGCTLTIANSNTSCCTATLSGTTVTIAASATGTAIITLTSPGNDTYRETTASCLIYIGDKPKGSITLGSISGTIETGSSTTVSVLSNLSGGTLSVSSSSTSVAAASISGSTITITGVAAGTATITVNSAESSAYTAASISFTIVVEERDYLCFTALSSNSKISMIKYHDPTVSISLQYSTDKTTWYTFTPGSTTVTLSSSGSKVYFRGDNSGFASSEEDLWYFEMSGSIAASGNIMSLLDSTCQSKTIGGTYAFNSLFYDCDVLTTAPKLPATTLSTGCYIYMFENCSSLTTPPALPALSLPEDCYAEMFRECSSLNVYSSSGTGHTVAWRIPTSGTATGSTTQNRIFYHTNGDYRSSSTSSPSLNRTFYTTNTPVS